MASKSFDQRLERLEALLKPRQVYAFLFHDTQRVALVGSLERMSVEEFCDRYPDGKIVVELQREALLDQL